MNELIKLNADLMGFPAGGLIVIFAIALGYLLKTIPAIDNCYIPLIVVCFCTLGFMLAAPARDKDMPLRIYLTRNFIIGFVLGFGAWLFHRQILRRYIDPKLFKGFETQQIQNPDAPISPEQKQSTSNQNET